MGEVVAMGARMPSRGSAASQLAAGGLWLVLGLTGLVVAEDTFVIGGADPERMSAARAASEAAVWVAVVHGLVGLGPLVAGARWWAWLPAVIVPAFAGIEQARQPELTISALSIWFVGIPVVAVLLGLSVVRSSGPQRDQPASDTGHATS